MPRLNPRFWIPLMGHCSGKTLGWTVMTPPPHLTKALLAAVKMDATPPRPSCDEFDHCSHRLHRAMPAVERD
jgi:hypothetical protein